MKHLALTFAAACMAALALIQPAAASERDPMPGIAYDTPLRFRSADGGAFQPRAVIITGTGGALAAALPGAANVRPENRVDLSDVPALGPLFRPTLDVASVREGVLIGPVYRVGDRLVIDAGAVSAEAARRPIAIATNIPRYGAISYRLGRLDWRPSEAPSVGGEPIGSAHLVGGTLVLASQGGEPAWPSIEAFLRDLF